MGKKSKKRFKDFYEGDEELDRRDVKYKRQKFDLMRDLPVLLDEEIADLDHDFERNCFENRG